MRRLRSSSQDSYSLANKVVCKRISTMNRDTLPIYFTECRSLSPMHGIKKILNCFFPLLLWLFPNSSCGFRLFLLFFLQTGSRIFLSTFRVKARKKKRKRNGKTFYPSPYAQKHSSYYHIHIHTHTYTYTITYTCAWRARKHFHSKR